MKKEITCVSVRLWCVSAEHFQSPLYCHTVDVAPVFIRSADLIGLLIMKVLDCLLDISRFKTKSKRHNDKYVAAQQNISVKAKICSFKRITLCWSNEFSSSLFWIKSFVWTKIFLHMSNMFCVETITTYQHRWLK